MTTALSVGPGHVPTVDLVDITVTRPVVTTVRGAQIPDWTQPPVEIVTVHGCSVQPGGGSTDTDNRDALSASFTVWAPAELTVGPLDQVTVPGYAGTLMLTGEPQQWVSPELGLDHVVLALTAWVG